MGAAVLPASAIAGPSRLPAMPGAWDSYPSLDYHSKDMPAESTNAQVLQQKRAQNIAMGLPADYAIPQAKPIISGQNLDFPGRVFDEFPGMDKAAHDQITADFNRYANGENESVWFFLYVSITVN